jgi:hypothetical protein
MSTGRAQASDAMNAVAERYAHLVLALGQHDPDYVDAFYGPTEWKTQAQKEKKSLDAIGAEAAELIAILAKTPDAATSGDEMLKLRREYLQKQVAALAARVAVIYLNIGSRYSPAFLRSSEIFLHASVEHSDFGRTDARHDTAAPDQIARRSVSER